MTSMLFRTAQLTDLEGIHQLAINSGDGITTLPKSIDVLKQRLLLSLDSLQQPIQKPYNEYYLFVLEDPNTKTIIGTSAIEASTGHETPFFNYKITKRTAICHELGIHRDDFLLILVNDMQGKTEICTLYLDPNYRHSYHSLLLSRSRFLFMAGFPQRFEATVIAELRGVIDQQGHSPFWDSVGQHFFSMPFARADELTLSSNKQFITDLLPDYPINTRLLPQKAQEVIGMPHQASQAAMHILLSEGFSYNQYVDIFDAGPTVEAPRSAIHTLKNSTQASIGIIQPQIPTNDRYLIANTSLSFRATINALTVEGHQISINQETADLLGVKTGDPLRFAPLHPNPTGTRHEPNLD